MPVQPTLFNEFLTLEDIEELYTENVAANFGYLLNGTEKELNLGEG